MSATNYNYYLLRKGNETRIKLKQAQSLVGSKNISHLISGDVCNTKSGEIYAQVRI